MFLSSANEFVAGSAKHSDHSLEFEFEHERTDSAEGHSRFDNYLVNLLVVGFFEGADYELFLGGEVGEKFLLQRHMVLCGKC